MMEKHYTGERNIQIILALLKAHNIRKVIASPGSCNHTIVASMQNDSFFEMYSSVDERSAAYMACGLCAESGEPVVITCTEATASRNYMPGLTEAYYRKLPILAITTTHGAEKVGHFVAQVIDHTVLPKDVALYHTYIPSCHTLEDEEQIALKVNEAILELTHRGGGPVYLNVESIASRDYSVKKLPKIRKIERFTYSDPLPELPEGRIGIRIGAHKRMNDDDTDAIDKFCEVNNAVVFCDHTSGYKGKYRVNYALIGGQERYVSDLSKLRLLIHIGEVSGDYFSEGLARRASEVWRVSEDGVIHSMGGGKIHYVFEMSEKRFFSSYIKGKQMPQNHIINEYRLLRENINNKIGELPFSKIWIASELCLNLPSGSCIHFSILGSLRAGNFFEIPDSVNSDCNVGGFGIDGATSSLIGASLANKDKLYFLMTGDLAFFYDLYAIGNGHISNNVRILLVNNGLGAEFKLSILPSSYLGEDVDSYIAAKSHFGNKSHILVKKLAEDLGYHYLTASTKEEFEDAMKKFVSSKIGGQPILFECFTAPENENEALQSVRNIDKSSQVAISKKIKDTAKSVIGERAAKKLKSILKG